MLEQLAGVIVIWLTSFVNGLRFLGSNDSTKILGQAISLKWLGGAVITISTLALGWQSYQVYNRDLQNRQLRQVVAVTNSRLFNETSGGVAIHDIGYLVDDEKPRIFKLRLVDEIYQFVSEIKLRQAGKILTGDDVDDLESVAVLPGERFNNRIYLLTSHSNTKKGVDKPERRKILEVSLESGSEGVVLRSNGRLRESILNLFKQENIEPYKNEDDILEGIQIEGFALDPNGFAYLGLRAPLDKDKNAIVLRARLDELFTANPSFNLYRLNLSNGGKDYGISSLDYDPITKKIWIVANSPEKSVAAVPYIWQWEYPAPVNDDILKSPIKSAPIRMPSTAIGRPESILFPPAIFSDQVFLFLDADDEGDGGQISIKRSELVPK